MHRQKVQNRPLSAVRGLLVVAGLIAVLVVASTALSLLAPSIGEGAASIVFWIVGIAAALWTMRRFILCYSYALNGVMLRVTYAYGRYERPMCDVYLRSVLAAGAPEDIRKRWSSARVQRATRPGCALEPLAVAYNDGNRTAILVVQPDDDIRQALLDAAKPKKKK